MKETKRVLFMKYRVDSHKFTRDIIYQCIDADDLQLQKIV